MILHMSHDKISDRLDLTPAHPLPLKFEAFMMGL
jgi:hypothetical protein